MADDDSAQEKTEEPTAKRLEKAREEGQVPRSREFTTTAVILTGAAGLAISGGWMAESLARVSRYNFALTREDAMDPSAMLRHFGLAIGDAMLALAPLFVALLIAAVLGPLALGGWNFSSKAIAPKLSRLSPIAGLKRMFSLKSLVELLKSIGKVLIVMLVTLVVLQITQNDLLNLSALPIEAAMANSLQLATIAAVILCASTIIIAMIDIPWQIFEHKKNLRMSRQDIKDELKDSEGKPEVKSKIRQLQQEMAQRRMMASVPDADVVITNPTHFSVALKYDPNTMETPILLAKGIDHIALKIREVAKEHKIEFVEAPLLARAVYHTTELEQSIPHGLYVAVAQVLAYVFQLREYRRGLREKPTYPRRLDIPPDMRHF